MTNRPNDQPAMPSPRVIRRVLIANRGEIASRVTQAAHMVGIETVAVYSETDRQAPFVSHADFAVALGGTTAAETYLNVDRLIAVAQDHRCDAVHPGYGFLSEHATFAQRVVDAGLIWIGPNPEAIAKSGDKIAAKRIAKEVGVAMLPSIDLDEKRQHDWITEAASVGYPLCVKAAAGGGGRGMKLVSQPHELDQAVASVMREAQAAFGDANVFAERWLPRARHIEVQLIADQFGAIVHLGERECSIQRRNQKLIEETPSTIVGPALRQRLGDAAITLAQAIGYDSVGTVEFLVDADTHEFFFLEMNSRIQVEHRVTELTTGIDIVGLQLQIAQGRALSVDQMAISSDGHAIEVRLYAEDPSQDWLPSAGRIDRFGPSLGAARSSQPPGIMLDQSVESGTVIGTEFDPLLAKVIAYGVDRATAIAKMTTFLRGFELHGITTNRDAMVAILESPDFVSGNTTTGFIPEHPDVVNAGPTTSTLHAHSLAATMFDVQIDRLAQPWHNAPTAWRTMGQQALTTDAFDHRTSTINVAWMLEPNGDLTAEIDGVATRGRIGELGDDSLTLELAGVTRRFDIHRVDQHRYVNSSLGQTDLVKRARFPQPSTVESTGGSTAPVPGRIISIEVSPGDAVKAGQTLVILEAMKVEHHIRASGDGIVTEVAVATGDNVDAHQVLIRMEDM